MSDIKVGDKVHWTKTSSRGRSFSMVRREGTVTKINPSGELAEVKTPSRRTVVVLVADLCKEGERGQIDRVVEALRTVARGDD